MRSDVVLVRHAQPVIPHLTGPDEYRRPLTETGLAQAEHLIDDLAQVKPSLIASSPYLRAVQTVKPFARAMGMPVQTEHELREWDSGIGPTPDYLRHYAQSWADPDFARPGSESLRQLSTRATSILTTLALQHSTVVIGSHGTFIARALTGFGLATVDWPFSRAMPMPAIYHLRFADGEVTVTGPGFDQAVVATFHR